MAGHKRSRLHKTDWISITFQVPPELHAQLTEDSQRIHRSLSQHVLQLVTSTLPKARLQSMYKELMALEPKPEDPRTDQEISHQMEVVQQKYQASDWLKEKDELDSLDIETEIEWLNPGGWSG